MVQYNPFGDLRTITPAENRVFNDSNGSLIAVSYEARCACGPGRCAGDVALCTGWRQGLAVAGGWSVPPPPRPQV